MRIIEYPSTFAYPYKIANDQGVIIKHCATKEEAEKIVPPPKKKSEDK